jgi:hypothetical protein
VQTSGTWAGGAYDKWFGPPGEERLVIEDPPSFQDYRNPAKKSIINDQILNRRDTFQGIKQTYRSWNYSNERNPRPSLAHTYKMTVEHIR